MSYFPSTPQGEAAVEAYNFDPFKYLFRSEDVTRGLNPSAATTQGAVGYDGGGIVAPGAVIPGAPPQLTPQQYQQLLQLLQLQQQSSAGSAQQPQLPQAGGGNNGSVSASSPGSGGVVGGGDLAGGNGGFLGLGNDLGVISPGPLGNAALRVAGMLPGPMGLLGTAAGTLIKANNLSADDTAGQNAGLAPMGFGQVAGGLLGLNGYGSGMPGTRAYEANRDNLGLSGPNYSGTGSTDGQIAEARYLNALTPGGSAFPAPPSDTGMRQGGMGGGYQGYGGSYGPTEDAAMSGAGFARGGSISGAIRNTGGDYMLRRLARGSGLVKSITPGRADKIHASVPKGAYVVPADAVSSLGQGNTAAGGKKLGGMFRKIGAYKGGGDIAPTPVKLSGGEYVVHPHHVAALGHGDMTRGSAMMDKIVGQARAMAAQRAVTAPPPR